MGNLDEYLESFEKWADSPEGRKSIKEFFDRQKNTELVLDRQIQRLRDLGKFSILIQAAIKKYKSDEYVNRWYSRGIEPPEDLFWFLFEYAKKWGRECNDDEWNSIASMFTTEFVFCDGYYFERLDGQGSVIKITRQNEI